MILIAAGSTEILNSGLTMLMRLRQAALVRLLAGLNVNWNESGVLRLKNGL